MPSLQEVFDQTRQERRTLEDAIAAYYEDNEQDTEETETGDQGSSGSDTFTDEELDRLRELAKAGSEVASALLKEAEEEDPAQGGGTTDAGRRGTRWTEETPGEVFDRLIRRGGDRPKSLNEALMRKAKRRVAVFDGPI